MGTFRILQYPDPKLKRTARPVEDFNDKRLQQIIDDMFETFHQAENCAALAATQLDMEDPPMVTVIGLSTDEPYCLINPEVIERKGEYAESEGCMSVGCNLGVYEKVMRARWCKVKAFDRDGKPIEMDSGDDPYLAKCYQHEIDHLHGRIYLDHLSKLKRQRVDKKLDKYKRWIKERNKRASKSDSEAE